MGNKPSYKKISYENVQDHIKSNRILISTLSNDNQECLIEGTYPSSNEEKMMNELLRNNKKDTVHIYIYGKNCLDNSIYIKSQQLFDLGFKHISIYVGGLFEWLLLQDIYGDEYFATTKKELDILKYKPEKLLL